MIEKSLIIITFMYAVSFSMLAGQYVLGDVFGVTITNFEGAEIKSNLLDVISTGTLNSVTGKTVCCGRYEQCVTRADLIIT